MAEKTVSVRLMARVDQYVAAMNQAKAATAGFSKSSDADLRRVGGQLQGFGRATTVAVTAPIAALGVSSVNMARDFERSFSRMVGLAEVPASEVEHLQKAVLGLSGKTGQAPAELARGLYQAASSGLDAAAALEATEFGAKAAALGMGSARDVTGLLAAATAAYGKENITAAETMDMLTMAIREGRAEPDEMAHALGRVLPIAAQMGITFDEVAGATAYLSNIMGDTDITVTTLRDALVKLNNPTVKGRKALEEMGTSFEELQAAISEDGLLGALELLREHGFAENGEALSDLFADVQGFQAATALLNDESGALATTLGKTADAAGAFEEAWTGWLGTDDARVAQALGEIKVGMMELGDVLLPVAADVMGFVGDVAGAFTSLPDPVQGAITAMLGITAAVGPISWAAGTIIKNLRGIVAAMSLVKGATLGTALMGTAVNSGAGAAAGALAGRGLLGAAAGAAAGAVLPVAIAGGIAVGGIALMQTIPGGNDTDPTATGMTFQSRMANNRPPTPGERSRLRAQIRGARPWLNAGRVLAPPPTPRPDLIAGRSWLTEAGSAPDAGLPPMDSGMASRIAALMAGTPAMLREFGPNVFGLNSFTALPSIRGPKPAGAFGGSKSPAGFAAEFKFDVNNIVAQGQAMAEAMNEAMMGAAALDRVMSSAEWGRAGLDGAAEGLSNFQQHLFGSQSRIASQEAALDNMAEAFKEAGDTSEEAGIQFDLSTEKGRAGFAAMQEVAASMQPAIVDAFTQSEGSVDAFGMRIGALRADFIESAEAAGMSAEQANALADSIGLIPEDAHTMYELMGQEEARAQLALLQSAIDGLPETVQTAVEQKIIEGDYAGALAIIQEYYKNNPALVDAEPGDLTGATDALMALTEEDRAALIDALGGDFEQAIVALADLTEEERQALIDAILGGDTATAALERIRAKRRVALINAAMGDDNASGRLAEIARNRTVTITARLRTISGGTETSFRLPNGQVVRDSGGYVDRPERAILAFDGRPEAVFPLTRQDKMQALLADARVFTPVAQAMGAVMGRGGGSAAAVSSSSRGGETYVGHATLLLDGEPIARRVRLEFHDRDRRIAAGSRFG